MKKVLGIFLFLAASFGAFSQENPAPESVSDSRATVNNETPQPPLNLRPFRIGIKLGVPNVIGANVEFLTPLLNHRLSFSADYSRFNNLSGEDENGNEGELNYSYIEFGSNYYLRRQGKGPYASIAYGMLRFDAKYRDVDGSTGEGSANLNAINFKLGAKWGRGFYFRPELGYALLTGNSNFDVTYVDSDGDVTVENAEASGILTGGFIFNLGFGVAF